MIANNRRAARLTLRLILLVAPALAGCEGTSAPTAAPADQARQTLDSALGLWVEGKTVEAVKAASPSILVEDPAWKKGMALKKYEVRGDGKASGAERVFSVSLTLADASGKEKKEQVDYRVGTNPILTVFRAIF
jgi:hypothetical protein